MEGRRPIAIVVAGVFFLLVFGGLTVAALSSAELNFATVAFAVISLLILFAVLGALLGALREPPDE